MVASITASLIALSILGLAFSSTRGLALAAIAALVYIYPALVILIIAGAGLTIFLKLSPK